jgi:prepilin-type processing-associated H-X9-DG protein
VQAIANPDSDWAPVSEVAHTTVPTFICPADGRDFGGFGIDLGDDPWAITSSWAKTSYLGVAGTGDIDPSQGDLLPDKFDGVFPWWGSGQSLNGVSVVNGVPTLHPYVKEVDISDGASNTVMIGERPHAKAWTNDHKDFSVQPWGNWFSDAFWQTRLWVNGHGSVGFYQGWHLTTTPDSGTTCPTQVYFSPGDLDSMCHLPHFWSFHDGGGNWLFCDGSVHFLRYSAGTTVLPKLATIAGEEAVAPPFE